MKSKQIRFNSLVISAFLMSLIACGGGSSPTPTTEGTPSGGNTPPDVSAGDFELLTATVELAGMPEVFITGNVEDNPTAYLDILIDANFDSTHTSGDLVIGLSVVTDAQTRERSLNCSLYESLGPSQGKILLADVNYQIDGNKVVFSLEKAQSELLNVVSSQSQVSVSSVIFSDTNSVSSDYLPGYNVFTQVQHNSLITDPQGDYEGDNGDIDILEFRLALTK